MLSLNSSNTTEFSQEGLALHCDLVVFLLQDSLFPKYSLHCCSELQKFVLSHLLHESPMNQNVSNDVKYVSIAQILASSPTLLLQM